MLKRIGLAVAALAVAAPAMAAPNGLDAAHTRLWTTMESKGVGVYLNPREVCYTNKGLMGVYTYNTRYDKPLMAICQDNRTSIPGREVAWTANDLDTLRHEAMHYIQDCVDGKVNMTLSPYFDGPGPSPGTLTHRDVIQALGINRARSIESRYRERGANYRTIRLEHEAFAIANLSDANTIADKINQICPAK